MTYFNIPIKASDALIVRDARAFFNAVKSGQDIPQVLATLAAKVAEKNGNASMTVKDIRKKTGKITALRSSIYRSPRIGGDVSGNGERSYHITMHNHMVPGFLPQVANIGLAVNGIVVGGLSLTGAVFVALAGSGFNAAATAISIGLSSLFVIGASTFKAYTNLKGRTNANYQQLTNALESIIGEALGNTGKQ